jgi:hypothetical protein
MNNSGQGPRWVPRGRFRAAAVTLALTGLPAVLGATPAQAADAPAPATAASPMVVSRILANHVLTAELVLLVLANVALVLAYRRYRRSLPAGPAPAAMAGDPWMKPPSESWSPAASEPTSSEAAPPDDYPSWPGRPGPYALHPDHPSWPGRPDPRWAATEAALRAEGDYPNWPGSSGPPWRPAERPADVSEPGWPGPTGPARQPR